MLRHQMSMELRSLYWIFMCPHCDYPLIASDLVVNDIGSVSCKNCGTEVYDVHYWNEEPTHHEHQSINRFPDDESAYTLCTTCGNAPFDETDDVTVDNYGNYVCCCGSELELMVYDAELDDYESR